MASTGTFLFHPELAELVDDAFEQAGVDPAHLTPRHLKSAARSAELMMGTWFIKGWTQWRIESATQALTAGVNTFNLPAGGWDIFHAMIAVNGEDAATPLRAISRSDWSAINDQTLTGRPDRYFVDRSTFLGADPRSAVTVYLVPDKAYDLRYWYIRRSEDIGNPANTLDLPWHWAETFTVNLAARIAKKFAPDRFTGLRTEAEIMLRDALSAERELAPLEVKVSAGGWRG